VSIVRTQLEREVQHWANIGHHALLQRFILITGRPFRAQPLPVRYRRAKPKECFSNAITLAKRSRGKLAYVEGYAMRDKLPGLLVHHAWCVDERGDVIDATWPDPEACCYFGRVFSLAEWERETDRTETMSALDGCGLNHVFMFDAAPGLRDMIERVRKEKPRALVASGAERSLPHDGKSDQTKGDRT
jgi:hypothetical protein